MIAELEKSLTPTLPAATKPIDPGARAKRKGEEGARARLYTAQPDSLDHIQLRQSHTTAVQLYRGSD